MKAELQQKIYDVCPKWFKDLQFGIECDSGWFDVIYDTMVKLKELNFEGPFSQIKEKYGVLNIYVAGGALDLQWKAIEAAEEKSETICEYCGKEGKLMGDFWLMTLCDDCKNAKKEESYGKEKS